jgi:hypothetical protein
MTNEEAAAYFIYSNETIISVAKDENRYNYETQQIEDVFMRRDFEAKELAIKALETASCIKEKCAYCPHCEHCDVDDDTLEIKALEQQPNDDCISRKAVKEMLMEEWTKYMPMESDVSLSFVLDKISELPSVTPEVESEE